jgi:hypothetical protein
MLYTDTMDEKEKLFKTIRILIIIIVSFFAFIFALTVVMISMRILIG